MPRRLRWLLRIALASVLAALPTPRSSGAQEASSPQARVLLKGADSLYQIGTDVAYQRATRQLNQAIVEAGSVHDFATQGQAFNLLGRIASAVGRSDSAVGYFWSAGRLAAQTADSSKIGLYLNNAGTALEALGQRDSAEVQYRAAIRILDAARDLKQAALPLANLGNLFVASGARDSASLYLARSLDAARRSGDSVRVRAERLNIARALVLGGALASGSDSLRRLVQEARARNDAGSERLASSNLGYALERGDSLVGALAAYRAALDAARRAKDVNGEASQAWVLAAFFRSHLGSSDSALRYFDAAIGAFSRAGNRRNQAIVLWNAGNVRDSIGQGDSAITLFRRAARLYHEVGMHREEAQLDNRMGSVYLDLSLGPEAAATYKRAHAIAHALRLDDEESTALVGLGTYYDDHEDEPDSALVYYRHALEVDQRRQDFAGITVILNNIASIYSERGQSDSALHVYQESLRQAHLHGVDDIALNLISVGSMLSGLHRDSALVYLEEGLRVARRRGEPLAEASALTNLGAYYKESVAPNKPRVAVAYYDSAAALISGRRRRIRDDRARANFADQGVDVYDGWTAALLSLAPEDGPRMASLAALAASERGHARQLLDLMRNGGAPRNAAPDNSRRRALTDTALAAEGQALVQAIGGTADAILVYSAIADTTFVWVIRGDSVRTIITLAGWDSLDVLSSAVRAGLGAAHGADRTMAKLESPTGVSRERGVRGARPNTLQAATALERLRRLILPNEVLGALPKSGEIVIVPAGPLGAVPFAALRLPNGEAFGHRYAIRYAPSLTTLAEAEKRQPVVSANRDPRTLSGSLVVADPRMPRVATEEGDSVRLQDLPGAAREGAWVASALGLSRWLSGAAATKSAVIARLPAAPIAHFATHGYVFTDETRDGDGFIALAPSRGDAGLLTVGEILDSIPKLNNELVVLSACETGLGNLLMAEGTVGLQRAFLAKGARSVLVSLWNVSDVATALLMRRFYRSWLFDADRPTKAEALRRAQDTVRADPRFTDPRYWAAFQLIGAR